VLVSLATGEVIANARYVVEPSTDWQEPPRRVRLIEAPTVDDFGVELGKP
jgi:hypothetical protein